MFAFVGPPAFGEYVNQWFHEKRAAMLGIIFSGAALGVAFWLFVHGQIIYFYGWRVAQIVMGIACVLFCGPLPIFVLKTPEQVGVHPYGEPKKNGEEIATVVDGLAFEEARKTPSFWLLVFSLAFFAAAFIGHQFYVVSYMQLHGMAATTSSNVASIGSLLKVFFVIIIGKLLDKKEIRPTIVTCCLFYVLGMVLLLLWGNVNTALILLPFISIILISFSNPIQNSGMPVFVTRIFGPKCYVQVSATVHAFSNLFSGIYAYLLGLSQDVTGDMTTGFIIITIPVVISLVMILIAFAKAPYKPEINN